MKKNFLVAFISILIISTMAYATSYVIHDYDTGVMHMAQDIYLTNTNSVQTQIDSIETNLNGSYALKSGTLSQFTGGTNLNQIATRTHSDLQNINGSESYQHLTTAEVANITLKSGSLTQITTRNHNDLQNLNAGSAHPSASIDNTSTSYGKGLAITDVTLQKISDRVNQNGTPQFVTDKTKCSLLLDFKGTLTDKSAGIRAIGSDSVNKWTDGYVNDSTTKASATNISCTLKQFEGDEGKFGSGIAVEESRTNLLLYSDDLTNAAWTKTNCTVTLDRILPDGRKLFKLVASNSGAYISQSITATNIAYSFSISIINTTGKTFVFDRSESTNAIQDANVYSKLTKLIGTQTLTASTNTTHIGVDDAISGTTIYITSPQLEAGAFPTSYIATGASAVTRPVGKITFNNSNANLYKLKNQSVSLQVKLDKYDTSKPCVIFASGACLNGSDYFSVWFEPNNNIIRGYFVSGGNLVSDMLGSIATNFNQTGDNNVVVSVDDNYISIYVNGTLRASSGAITSAKHNPGANAVFTIGMESYDYAANSRLNGTISNFAIFNYALTADEISQIYNSGLEGKPIAITNPETIIPVGQSLYDTNFITFTSGWGISSTYPNKPTLSKSSNVALMRGILEYSGVVNSDVTLFTLPAGARPSLPDTSYHSFVATARDSGAPAMRIIRVYGNGDVVLMAQGATIVNPAISLDNINFVNGK